MIKVLSVVLMLFIHNLEANDEVWIFSTSFNQTKFHNHSYLSKWTIKHFILDGAEQFEAELTKNLSSDPNIARQQLEKLITSNKQQLRDRAKLAWQGVINAQSLGIEKTPAISFDKGKTVIYGVFNLLEAYRIFDKQKK